MSVYRFTENPGTPEILCHVHASRTSDLNSFKLRQAWDACDLAKCHLHPENIDPGLTAAMNALLAAGARPPAEEGEEPLLHSFVVAMRRDAICTVKVSDDRMHAEAEALAPEGGEPLGWSSVCAAIESAGVIYGIDEGEIQLLIKDCAGATAGITVHRCVASGLKPGKPLPSRFENLVTPFQDRVLRPVEREDGSVDFHELGEIESVHEGDPLVRRHPPRPGRPGYDVFGEPLMLELPAETPFAVGEGTVIDAEDAGLLRASRGGVPHRLANGMSVNDVLQVMAVDLHTGNIDLDGSLVVKGDVHSDMRVRVTGDVIVGGFIEAAQVSAGGDITAKQGIIGPTVQSSLHSCSVTGRNITTRYAQNASLEAGEDITVGLNLLQCHVVACRNLSVGGDRNRTSRISGGAIHARVSVSAGIFGSEKETTTRIVMDDAILKLRREADSHYSERLEIEDTCEGLEHSLHDLRHKPASPAIDTMIERVEATIGAYREQIAAFDAEESAKRQLLSEMTAACRVVARAQVHPGLELQCMDARHRFSVAKGPTTFGVRDGHWTAIDS